MPGATASRCGSSYTTVQIRESPRQKVTNYAISTNVIARGDAVGLFAWQYESATVGVLDVNRLGRVRIADSFVIADPVSVIANDVEIPDSDKSRYVANVRRVQNFLRSSDLGLDREPQKTQAAQVAIWQSLGQLDVPSGLTEGVQRSPFWRTEIKRHAEAIQRSDDAYSTESNFPYKLSAALAQSQRHGSISIEVLAIGVDGTPATSQSVIVSNLIASSTVVTDSKGKADAVLPDPLPGHPQSVQVVWEGTIPAGTFLRAVYSEATAKEIKMGDPDQRLRTGYLVTAHRTSGRIQVAQLRPGGKCS